MDLFGSSAGKSDMKKSNRLMQEAVARLEALGVPSVEAQKIALQDPELQGLLEAEQLAESQMENVSVDPRMRNAQMKALEEMSGLSQTGLGAEDKSAFNALRRQVAGEAQAQNQAVLQNAAAQGTLNSGNTLMAQLNAGQQSANRGAEGADRLASDAAKARRAALAEYGNMATTMGQNDFSNKSSVAQAQDAISKFNTQNRQDVNTTNLNSRQNIANAATANRNQEQVHNKGLVQQKFQNDFAKAGGVSNAVTNLANNYASQGQAAAQGQANMNGALLGAAAGMGSAYLANDTGTTAKKAK